MQASTLRNDQQTRRRPPRIYYVHPLMLDGMSAWSDVFDHAAALGFDTVLSAPPFLTVPGESVFVPSDLDHLTPSLQSLGNTVEGLQALAAAARQRGLNFMIDIVIDRISTVKSTNGDVVSDPRISPEERHAKHFSTGSEAQEEKLRQWQVRLDALVSAGISGFRCLGIDRVPSAVWTRLISAAREIAPDTHFYAWTPGTAFSARRTLQNTGFDGAFSSVCWWDQRGDWIVEEHDLHRAIGLDIAFPEAPFGRRVAHGAEDLETIERKARRALLIAAEFGDGLLIPMGFEFGASLALDMTAGNGRGISSLRHDGLLDLSGEVRRVNANLQKQNAAFERQSVRVVVGSSTPVSILIRSDAADARFASTQRLIAVNSDLRKSALLPVGMLSENSAGFLPLLSLADGATLDGEKIIRLLPGDVRVFEGKASKAILSKAPLPATDAAATPRLAIEEVTPSVDDGRFAVKTNVGQTVRVEADIFGDGHDPLSASLMWRAVDEDIWSEVRMQLIGNDRWWAEFELQRMGRHEFVIEAWRDPFAIFRYELVKKNDAKLDLKLELQEGLGLVKSAIAKNSGDTATRLETLADSLTEADDKARVQLLLAGETSSLMKQADHRPFKVRSAAYPVDAERQAAGFASWYQIFPRSQSGDPNRHGTFDDVIGRLPAIRDMGFDVLYFPPIHPIGKTNRKGRNNTLNASEQDPGSPYAIGAADGGHDAIHSELGTFADFDRLVEAAHEHGLEIALDLAIQASPDHPWLKQHPGWFDWRPDGTVRYAENPPKKYEDIVNVDFYAKDAVPGLWTALRDVVQLWVDHGVKLFRVDNPHTKPFPFWEWMIADIRSRHPDVVFLSEAFTKPKVMYRLAKVGFSQSYTYFTWRNAKWELEAYMRELTETAPKDFFRPHFFVNTHDINPDFLQNAPRSAYLIRAALAATLSGLWGVYNGFELCEGRPDAKRKEYADSEKYEIRAWDWDRPGNIIAEITRLNGIRKHNPALHSHLGLTLLPAWNDNILFFEKATPSRDNVVLVAVSLDPHNVQEADVEIPLWASGLPDNGSLFVEDLMHGNRMTWTGKRQHLRFEPGVPFSIWRSSVREI
ncbi:alpha-1,4-glucan--maltose-1-phosphate maltosyltransferase [Rhizobium tumorigenes]|uniref:alpha-1,4-glucan--maltose-1-phosphate maltosyltransferase n=1 Tax=Rhizobium tumorigenes TaxID=2041385 RepID=UPI00241DB47D|nr:alpha-1,4-glucan--maltose-1-phosphate maltosyltransferase [Rhizobium tumorigenes]WFS04693.1 alpha-1,4-glucan--maltose-1-phosphate maltosyltransferase [Rhizobium tumorigenes]